jgi:hypothetical protein
MHLAAHPLPADPGLAGPSLDAATSLFWLVRTLAHYGPSWEALGPIYYGRANLGWALHAR